MGDEQEFSLDELLKELDEADEESDDLIELFTTLNIRLDEFNEYLEWLSAQAPLIEKRLTALEIRMASIEEAVFGDDEPVIFN